MPGCFVTDGLDRDAHWTPCALDTMPLYRQSAWLQWNANQTFTVRIMKHVINPGDKYGRLTVVREVQKVAADGRCYRAALCRCDCGAETTPRISSLNSG